MIETNDYWILDNKLIFKPKFNESIEKYYDLISNYDTLIFSNYNDVNICIETNNKYEYNYRYEYNKSEFNKKVELPINITHLTFGDYFNQKVELPINITHLTFGWCFNQKVELPINITHLTFGYYFNQKV